MDTPQDRTQILCIGDMVADIFASPLKRLPEPGELVLTEDIAVYPGGNALNTAIALRRIGEPVAIAGSVGDDALGRLLLDQLEPWAWTRAVCVRSQAAGQRPRSSSALRARIGDSFTPWVSRLTFAVNMCHRI